MSEQQNGNSFAEEYRRLKETLRSMKRVLIAFSGGVDSSLLLFVARQVLPRDDILAVTAVSEVMPRHEKEDALTLAKEFDVEHLLIEGPEMEDLRFRRNPHDKCYLCKKKRYESLIRLAGEHRLLHVLDGENADDHKDYRPGSRAACELGVRSPLSEAGFTKPQIRGLSKNLGLPTWDKPSCACLASRIPYHNRITVQKLKQIDQGEAFIRSLNISQQVRLRHHGEIARLELSAQDLPNLVFDEEMRNRVVGFLKSIGFLYVALDLEGYSVGSLNREIVDHL